MIRSFTNPPCVVYACHAPDFLFYYMLLDIVKSGSVKLFIIFRGHTSFTFGSGVRNCTERIQRGVAKIQHGVAKISLLHRRSFQRQVRPF